MPIYRVTTSGARRVTSSGADRITSTAELAPALLPYNPFLGFHADEDNGLEDPALVTVLFDACRVTPQNANGAMALWRHLDTSHYAEFLPQRQAAAALGYESPTIIVVPFTNSEPGTNDEAENLAALDFLAEAVTLYAAENPIFGFGNLTSENFMPEASIEERTAAWFALEARAIKLVSDAGYRWCATDDRGLVTLVKTITQRRAAWTLEGVDPDDCEFLCAHCYVDAGWVPAHYLLAKESLARAHVPTTIRITELAFGFLGAGNTDENKPWLLNEYQPGNPQGYPAHSLTWTRILPEWCASTGTHGLIFDATRLQIAGALSSWGLIFTEFQNLQPAFVAPPLGSLWYKRSKAVTKAYQLRLSNGGTVEQATAAAERVQAGYIFTIVDDAAAGAPTASLRPLADVRLQLSEAGADLAIENGDLALEEGLASSAVVSLFSDGRAPASVSLPAGSSRRGFWGAGEGESFGSLLWLLDREKITPTTIERMRAYAADALQWMVDEGIADQVEVVAERGDTYQVNLQIQLRRGAARRWEKVWAGTDADPLLISGLRVQILTL